MLNLNSDKRQEQLKKRKNQRFHKWFRKQGEQFFNWFRKPETLRLLFRVGPIVFKMLKWLYDNWHD